MSLEKQLHVYYVYIYPLHSTKAPHSLGVKESIVSFFVLEKTFKSCTSKFIQVGNRLAISCVTTFLNQVGGLLRSFMHINLEPSENVADCEDVYD